MAAYVSGGVGGGGHQSDCRAECSAEGAPGLHLGAAVMSSEASSVPNIKLHFAINEIQSAFYKQQKLHDQLACLLFVLATGTVSPFSSYQKN